MGTQTRTFQRRVLEGAQRDGYAGLYWYVEMMLPGRVYASAAYPWLFVPVVPVAPDPEISRHWAHMLSELFKHDNPGVEFQPALTAIDVLQSVGLPWYEWGHPVTVDVVCAMCGGIGQIDASLLIESSAWVCSFCAE
jgi:hypothetical protein